MRLIRFAPAAMAFAFAPLASAQWSDGFESYAQGSAIEGQGTWSNWSGPASNQPWNTVKGTTGGVAPFAGSNMLSVRADHVTPAQTAQALVDTVSDLNGPYTAGAWTFTAQSYVPSSMVGSTYTILLNQFSQTGGTIDWSYQAQIDPGAALYDMDVFNAAVVTTIGGGQVLAFDRWAEIKVEVDLNTGMGKSYYDGVLMYEFSDWANILNPSGGGLQQIDYMDLYPATVDTTEIFYDEFEISSGIAGVAIGTNYCMTNPNSTGNSGRIDAYGSSIANNNDVTLVATDLPDQSFAFFLTSTAQAQVNNPGGSSGNLCLGGQIGRYVGAGQIQNTGTVGEASLVLDLTNVPQPNGSVSISAGQTWNFQCWHRDIGSTSNFTDATSILFL